MASAKIAETAPRAVTSLCVDPLPGERGAERSVAASRNPLSRRPHESVFYPGPGRPEAALNAGASIRAARPQQPTTGLYLPPCGAWGSLGSRAGAAGGGAGGGTWGSRTADDGRPADASAPATPGPGSTRVR